MLYCALCRKDFIGNQPNCRCKQDVLASCDLDTICADQVKLWKRYNREYRGICPIHSGASNPTGFSVYYDHGSECWKFKCFAAKCGEQGDIFDFLSITQGMDYTQALFHLAGRPMPVREERFVPAAKPPSPVEIEWEPALAYHRNLRCPIPGTDTDHTMTARDWWLQQGLDVATIERFKVGYSASCPTFRRSPSFTIPIGYCNGSERKLVGVRHRLTNPPEPNDKYRPEFVGQIATLFGTETIFYWPDGSPRPPEQRQELIICEGEKKLMVACRWGMDNYLSLVTATAGAGAWKRDNGRYWAYKLSRFAKVYVVFDPDAEEAAERTASLFKRRGHLVLLDRKLDDILLQDGMTGFHHIMNALCDAPAYRERSYWEAATVEA